MIDYKNPHNYQRSVTKMLEHLVWCTAVAGKSSQTITPRFNKMLEKESINNVIRSHGNRIRGLLREYGIGQYNRLSRCWSEIGNGSIEGRKCSSGSFLKHAPREHFTLIHGIGFKTASFFIQSTREHSDVAVLDVHILRWLAEEFPKYPVPSSTPQDVTEYLRLEAMFIGASAVLNLTPAELDLELWLAGSKN